MIATSGIKGTKYNVAKANILKIHLHLEVPLPSPSHRVGDEVREHDVTKEALRKEMERFSWVSQGLAHICAEHTNTVWDPANCGLIS